MNPHPEKRPLEDARVTAVYRSIATEEASAALNANVLQKARAATRPGYARSVRWFRPLAWAASLVLCVAIVIDTSKLAETADDRAAAFKVTDAPILHDAAALARLRRDPGRDGVAVNAPESSSLESSAKDNANSDSLACTTDEQATPIAWYGCVRQLEFHGRTQAAEVQKQALQQSFPNFELPGVAR